MRLCGLKNPCPGRALNAGVWATLGLWCATFTGCSWLASDPLAQSAPTPEEAADTAYRDSADEESTDSVGDLLPTDLAEAAARAVGLGTNRRAAQRLYAEAESQYAQANQMRLTDPNGDWRGAFAEASGMFSAAANKWPDSALQQDALFFAGEGMFFADDFPAANQSYEELLKLYPNTKYIDLVQARRFSIAEYWVKYQNADPESFFAVNVTDASRPWRDSFGNAVRIFNQIPIDDPTGKLADDAILAAGNALFNDGRYLAADRQYDDLRKTFPSSEHQFLAHFMGVKTKLLSYLGPEYDGTSLDDAEALVKQIRRQFPQEAAQNREALDRAHREIRYRQAEREWVTAKFYDRRKAYSTLR